MSNPIRLLAAAVTHVIRSCGCWRQGIQVVRRRVRKTGTVALVVSLISRMAMFGNASAPLEAQEPLSLWFCGSTVVNSGSPATTTTSRARIGHYAHRASLSGTRKPSKHHKEAISRAILISTVEQCLSVPPFCIVPTLDLPQC